MKEDLRILLIEDSEDDALLLIRELKKSGYEPFYERVDTEKDLISSLEKSWNIVISDYSMPSFSGMSALKILKEREIDIPFIIVSGVIGEDTAVDAIKAGANDYLMKNNLKRFVPAVERALRETEGERERKRAEERYRKLVETSPDSIVLLDLELNLIMANHQTALLLGFNNVEELLSYSRKAYEFVSPEDRYSAIETTEETLKKGLLRNIEYRILKKDGSSFPVELSISLIRDMEGKPESFIVVVRDITERKKAEEERRKFEAQLQQAQKLESLGILAGGIAHDFNNILTGILGYADLTLMDLSPYSPAIENIKRIIEASHCAANLTRQMLAYSGKGKFILKSIQISDLVEKMSHLLEVSISKKCTLKYDFEKDIPFFEGDVSQIQQVVMNLIINASEAIGDVSGVISLRTGFMECKKSYLEQFYLNENLSEGPYVYLEVTDTGSGMTGEIRDKIFDPFFTTKFTGRGLGLASVLGIVRGHKGAIRVNSEPGKGTGFKVLFPVVQKSEDHTLATLDPSRRWKGKGTILIIDDEETVRKVSKKMLERLGFDVITASDGYEGLNIFRENAGNIDVVLLDMTMPEMDGEETLREIRISKKDIPVILTSGYNEQDALERFKGEKLSGFIQKPYVVAEMVKVLRDVLKI